MQTAVVLSVTAFLTGIAIMMNIFACTIADNKNLYPLLVLFLQLLAPVPLVLFGFGGDVENMDGDVKMPIAMGWFVTGMFFSMALLIPIIMAHEGTLSGMQLGLVLGSEGLTYLVFGSYMKFSSKDEYSGF